MRAAAARNRGRAELFLRARPDATLAARLRNAFQLRSLKTRITIFTLMIFLASIWALAFLADRLLREDMERLLGHQQFSTVSILAREINHDLEERLHALEMIAERLAPLASGKPILVGDALQRLPILLGMFNGGVMVLDLHGKAIADAPRATGRVGINYRDTDSVAAALKDGKSTIGRPALDTALRGPAFAMTTPIRDARGRVVGAVSGVTRLDQPNFVDNLTSGSHGKTGGYLLVSPRHRLIVTATDKSRILQASTEPGISPLIDSFHQGFEGSGVTVNSFGLELLASAKGIPMAGWFIAAALPAREAFAPIHDMRRRLLLASMFLTLLAGSLIWWVLRRQLSPMHAAATAIAARSAANQPPRPLPITRQDEIGELIGGFNRLLESLKQREATLSESEARYRAFFEFCPDAILVHRDNIIIFANEVAARLFQVESATALLGRDWHQLIAPEDWPLAEARIAALIGGETAHMPPLERHHQTLDGQVVIIESTGARIIFDGRPAVLTVMRDITERRHAEDRRLADARRQRDALVREVHHRIKNNLQSVAGLLQLELGQFIELDPRLETAISQVKAIALVHGLQSATTDEAIHLCDSVACICGTIAELSQRPVLFRIEDEYARLGPACIDHHEAVAIALMLNELVLNAVKHSPPDGVATTVSLSADAEGAQLLIRNTLAAAPDFNIESGRGLGAGLRLVRSLMPERGARLVHEIDAGEFMLTRLSLTTPVIATNSPSREDR